MDFVFIVLVIVFTLALWCAYLMNGVPRTDDLMKIFTALKRQNPTAVAYSLGYDRHRRSYRNVFTRTVGGDRLEAYAVWEERPVTVDGEHVDPDAGHGKVEELQNGFRVSGLNDDAPFTCPEGYEGGRCQPIPLCTDRDYASATVRPLTYAQFNALDFYKNTFARGPAERLTAVGDGVSSSSSTHHPRIRVQCLQGGTYELQVCPDNKLIDPVTAECREYDICQDRVNGYKHNYRVDATALQSREYYLCVENVSVKKMCEDPEAVFDPVDQTCAVRSVCRGRGKGQIRVDGNNYIQCRADTGKPVHCEHGLQEHATDGTLSCVTKTCEPYTLRYEDGILDYVYGRNACDGREKLCDNTPVEKWFDYTWADPFQVRLANWPTTVLDAVTQECVAPTDDIIADTAVVSLAWSPAMMAAHDFNLKTQRYVCAEEDAYRWDYARGVVVPTPPTDSFVDPAAPCQTKAVHVAETAWHSLSLSHAGTGIINRYPTNVTPALVIAVELAVDTAGHNFWPVYHTVKRVYMASVLEYDRLTDTYTLTKYDSKHPPLGFMNQPPVTGQKKVPLRLVGYTGFPRFRNKNNYMYYFVASGETTSVQFSDQHTTRKTVPIRFTGWTPPSPPPPRPTLTDEEEMLRAAVDGHGEDS